MTQTMQKKLFFSAFLLLLFFACKKIELNEAQKTEHLEFLSEFVNNSKVIKDSIKKFTGFELLICTKRNVQNYTVVSIRASCVPFYINHEYVYRSINGKNVLFYNYDKPLTTKNFSEEIRNLIKKNIVKFDPSNRTCCDMPFYNFALCNDNPSRINCFDNQMINRQMEVYKQNEYIIEPEMVFYPNCD
ncbi:hypothetical protein FLJU110815_19400 [Flavobacterium jumunjinense]